MRAIITATNVTRVAPPATAAVPGLVALDAAKPAPPPPPPIPDDYLAKLVNLVPAEVVTLYGALAAYVSDDHVIATIAFAVGIATTLVWLSQPTTLPDGSIVRTPSIQYPISVIAFVLWATAIAHPIDPWLGGWYHDHPKILGVVVAAFTAMAPLLIRTKPTR
ncbi:MAG: hypothetical protein K8W52_02445 [Deltaproteobacteria bacterium]|nr:hypothetical protein [Deltaproteobacteria bacterium]